MQFDIKLQGADEIQASLRNATLLLNQSNMKKTMHAVGVTMQKDTKENFKKDMTYDDEKMPGLRPATWLAKNMGWGQYGRGKKAGKGRGTRNPQKLYVTGLLQKIAIEATPAQAVIYSPADYALPLNDRQKHGPPFKFMGFGKRLLRKIDETINKKIMELIFK